jgi:metal-responsive CopG/Arc/MetJ family transcriptional regulator
MVMKNKTVQLQSSVPKNIVKMVDLEAEKEHRSRSNMVTVLLSEALESRKEAK